MKVTFQTCCGVDVHKSFLVATIIKTSSGIEPSYQKRRFSTFNNSILEFKKWLLENECLYVCMESTGKYWIPVFNLLEDEINVTIANPKWVKAVIYLAKKSVFYVNLQGIAISLFPAVPVKRIGIRMRLLFVMSH